MLLQSETQLNYTFQLLCVLNYTIERNLFCRYVTFVWAKVLNHSYLIIHHIYVLWVLYCYCKLLNRLEKLVEFPKQSSNFSLLSKFIRLDLKNLDKAYRMKKRLLRKSVFARYLFFAKCLFWPFSNCIQIF